MFGLGRLRSDYLSNERMKIVTENVDKHLWLVCAPKSGSTWLSVVLENILNWDSVSLVPACGYREQEIDISQLLKKPAKGNVLSPHQHCRYSEYTEEFILKMESKVVLQTRDLFDTLVSCRDHWENESVICPMGYMNDSIWNQLDSEQQWSFLVDMIVPWYFNFYCGWVSSPLYASGKIYMVSYNELRNDPENTISGLLEFAGESVSNDVISKALDHSSKGKTRKNKAVVGRGQELPLALKERIRKYTQYYPGIDFGPMGL